MNGHRSGLAALWALLVLTVLTLLLASTTWQLVASRRVQERHYHRLQAVWLARAGVERAVARLLGDPAELKEEGIELLPASSLTIEVRKEPGSANTYRITSTARYPADAGPETMGQILTHTYRRIADGERVRLETVASSSSRE
jgi:hypothetical protein